MRCRWLPTFVANLPTDKSDATLQINVVNITTSFMRCPNGGRVRFDQRPGLIDHFEHFILVAIENSMLAGTIRQIVIVSKNVLETMPFLTAGTIFQSRS